MIQHNGFTSAIGWVDFSSEHREKVKLAIDLLSAPGVVDELGIGVIRDLFSDSLFPGISTIQTRAKYFLTVPRIFKDYEKLPAHKRRKHKLADFLNAQENRCMLALVENHRDDPQDGISGILVAGTQGEVQRKPSSVYWTGIRRFGLIQTDLSLQAFCRKFANPDQPLQDLVQGSVTTKGDDPDAANYPNDAINCPAYEDEWIDKLTVYLSQDEATFLSRLIAVRVRSSLLGRILLDAELRKTVVELPKDWNFTTFADQAGFISQLPDALQRAIVAARDFWQLMSGAHIRYNCLLQAQKGKTKLREEFESRWNDWRMSMRSFPWERWDTAYLWELAKRHHRKVGKPTTRFVESWILGVRNGADTNVLDELVIRQERSNKKSRARLQPSADGKFDKWVGIDDLNYRLNVARTIISDINTGITATEAGHA